MQPALLPIFDRHRKLVAWLDPFGENVFDTHMKFIAFIRKDVLYLLSARHIGFFNQGVFRDERARAVAFLKGVISVSPTPSIPPTPPKPPIPPKPPSPAKPPTPTMPVIPIGTFGPTSWEDLLNVPGN